MFLRETSKRRQFERHRRIKASTSQLVAEQHRSSALLLKMLPATIVKQLTVRAGLAYPTFHASAPFPSSSPCPSPNIILTPPSPPPPCFSLCHPVPL
jgi:hypothetical protein